MMRLLACVLLAMLSAAAWAQNQTEPPVPAPSPLVRTALHPATDIVIGQPVRLVVDVLFPGEMPRPPRVSVGDAPGAQIMRFETQATTIRDRIDGQDYVGQSFEFVVFPRRGGPVEVPSAQVTVLDRAGEPVGSARGQPMRLVATVPPGIDPSGPVLAASQVEVSQSWSPDPASAAFKAGGAVTRLIRRRASGVPALGMAEFRFVAPDGVRVYVDAPTIEDKVNRGEVEGVRTDKATYVFERSGTYALPDLAQPWWDMDGKRARSASLPGATITVAASGAAGRGTTVLEGRWILIALAGLAVLAGLFAAWPRLAAALRRRRDQHRASAAFARTVLVDTARGGDPVATYRALATWLERLSPSARETIAREPHVLSLRGKLERSLFGTQESWSAHEGDALAKAVEGLPAPSSDETISAGPALPPLNPPAASGRVQDEDERRILAA